MKLKEDFKVGNIVKIKSLKEIKKFPKEFSDDGRVYYKTCKADFTEEMIFFCGEKARIVNISDNGVVSLDFFKNSNKYFGPCAYDFIYDTDMITKIKSKKQLAIG